MLNRGVLILALLAFASSFFVYLLTLAPSIGFADAGELAAVCTTLGIAHPTGYPLFTILGHLWTKLPLPFAQVYKLNVFTAFWCSVSVVLFFELTVFLLRRFNELPVAGEQVKGRPKNRKRGRKPAPADVRPERPPVSETHLLLTAFGAALMYAFARTIWEQASVIEVYSFHLVFILLSIRLFLRAVLAEEPSTGPFLLWAFVLGLSFTHHLTMILLAPSMLFLYFKRLGPGRQPWRLILLMGGPFLAGLALYLYLPLRSAPAFPFSSMGIPEFDWGRVCRGWDKFVYHTTAKQYQTWIFTGELDLLRLIPPVSLPCASPGGISGAHPNGGGVLACLPSQ